MIQHHEIFLGFAGWKLKGAKYATITICITTALIILMIYTSSILYFHSKPVISVFQLYYSLFLHFNLDCCILLAVDDSVTLEGVILALKVLKCNKAVQVVTIQCQIEEKFIQ